ncbi:MAG: 5-(carboxyamino)imidazole ribonucleotide mutase [Nitrososphaerota archaeon]|nr:5-(carboxyamino)imidazole ribonucleotide mutase [Nitrososphaerales archaeon]MDW8044669.1 5-(carboxyamino)imidazole ribonucleotide mutase [Nitrososphaerota archaeon]
MKVAVISGSKSDQNIVDEVVQTLKEFSVEYETKILSAHRNHDELENYVKNSDADVFIGIAGLSAALPGFIASLTTKPVIGVPVSAKLGGLDSLLSIVQMPPRVPVACVGIDNGRNAALLAIQILAVHDKKLQEELILYRRRV